MDFEYNDTAVVRGDRDFVQVVKFSFFYLFLLAFFVGIKWFFEFRY